LQKRSFLLPPPSHDLACSIKSQVIDPKFNDINVFFADSCLHNEDFARYLDDMLAKLPRQQVKDLGALLNILHGGGGLLCFLFTGTFTAFPKLQREKRTIVLQSLRDAWLPLFRNLFSALKKMVIISYLKVSQPALKAICYPEHHSASSPDSPFHRFEFERFPATDSGFIELEADIVIVGSGAGGGVVAAKLASQFKGTKRIVVLERGDYIPQSQLPLRQTDYNKLYDGSIGAFMTKDGKGAILAGATWGGSMMPPG